MKIALNMGNAGGNQSARVTQAKVTERDILGAKKGDWNAKNSLVRTFLPLIASLAEKRSKDPHSLNDYVEAGKDGLFRAARKYTPGEGIEKFDIFVVDFIDEAMNRHDKGGGFWSRLFGR